MVWNHRILRRQWPDGTITYQVHEVYYDPNGKPTSCTEEPVEPFGETLEELQAELALFTRAATFPVLNYEDI